MDDFEFVDTGKRSAEISESATLVLQGLYTILYKMSKNVLTDKNITILFTVVHCTDVSRTARGRGYQSVHSGLLPLKQVRS